MDFLLFKLQNYQFLWCVLPKYVLVYFFAASHVGDDFVWNPVLTILTLILENFPSY